MGSTSGSNCIRFDSRDWKTVEHTRVQEPRKAPRASRAAHVAVRAWWSRSRERRSATFNPQPLAQHAVVKERSWKEFCTTCGGRGRDQVTKPLTLTIPAGVDTGSRLRVRGEGDAGPRGGPASPAHLVRRLGHWSLQLCRYMLLLHPHPLMTVAVAW